MGVASIGTTIRGIALLLALCCVAVALLAACGDTRPTPTVTAPITETVTPVPTPTSTPVPTATPTAVAVSPDRAALVALYESAGGDKWSSSDNWLSDRPLDTWYGVTTDDGDRVTELVLVENGLVGNIPPELGDLSSMERSELRGNWLVGLMPSELGKLSSLKVLDLSENRLIGGIPSEWGGLVRLEVLNLHDNALGGGLPSELGNLSNLRVLDLSDNSLAGRIPLEFGKLSNLTELRLEGLRISGCIPENLAQLVDLLGRSCVGMEALVVLYHATDGPNWKNNDNWLSDKPLERWYGVATDENGRVVGLALGENQLKGGIPPELGTLLHLTELDVQGNWLRGEIPRLNWEISDKPDGVGSLE